MAAGNVVLQSADVKGALCFIARIRGKAEIWKAES